MYTFILYSTLNSGLLPVNLSVSDLSAADLLGGQLFAVNCRRALIAMAKLPETEVYIWTDYGEIGAYCLFNFHCAVEVVTLYVQ